MKTKLKYIIPGLLFAACSVKKEKNIAPPSLHPEPTVVKLNTGKGYKFNAVTGDSIETIITRFGDTLVTGKPILINGKIKNPKNVSKPEVVKFKGSNIKIEAHPNIHYRPGNPMVRKVDKDNLTVITSKEISQNDTEHYLINSTGDTLKTGVEIMAKGKMVPLIRSKPVTADPPRYRDAAIKNIQYLDVDQGMSSSYILSMLEDKNGCLWFGTHSGGVSRYNGECFMNFTENEGLSNNVVHSMLEDIKGNLWFGTSSGVSMYDGESFTYFTEREGLCNNMVLSIVEDKNDNLWFGTTQGVSMYNGKSFINYTVKEGLSANIVRSMLEDKNGNLWFGTLGNGVCMFNGESFTHYTEKDGLGGKSVHSMLEDKKGNLWFGVRGSGLSMFDGESFTYFGQEDGLNNNTIVSMLEDKNGNLWFGGWKEGVSMYNGEFFTHFTKEEGLSGNSILSILEGKNGNLWVGTNGGGISIFNGQSFTHFAERMDFVDNAVMAIVEDKNKDLWFGTRGAGVGKYNGESFTFLKKKDGLSSNQIFSILEDKSGNMWFGSWGDGVSKYDGKSFTNYTKNEGLSDNVVMSMLEDRKGNLWIGTKNHGLTMYNGEFFTHYTEKQGFSNNKIWTIFEDKGGNLWFGTNGGGVSRFDGEFFTHYTEKEGLSDNVVMSILEDKNGNLWFGTERGVCIYDGKSFVSYTEKEGLSNNMVWSLVEDKTSTSAMNVWLATEKGLANFVSNITNSSELANDGVEKMLIKAFEKNDGLRGLDFLDNSVCLDSKNRIWWGSGRSLTMLDLKRHKSSEDPPRVNLNGLDVNGHFIDYRNFEDSLVDKFMFTSVEKFENYPLNLELPHDQNHLTFRFGAIDWFAPHKIQYTHMVENLSSKWSKPSSEAKADYRNLPSGAYTFKVCAIGESGKWSKPFEYAFIIHPPWWNTMWFRILILLGFVGVLYLLYKWRTTNLKQNQKVLEAKVKMATKEIREQKKVVEISHKEIKDSIRHAKRLQDAILPSLKEVDLHLPGNFIYFQPKDVVSGDFYWFEKVNNYPYLAVADCTGHGVPGAMVSVVCSNALNRSIKEFGITEPAKILDKTRQLVIETFAKSGEGVKDGMDLVLCAFQDKKVIFSGANNPLWIVRKTNLLTEKQKDAKSTITHNDLSLIEYKGSKQPIGLYRVMNDFVQEEIEVYEGDSLYFFTDGFADQFGGEKGKKLKYKPFKQLILELSTKPMKEQKHLIAVSFQNWKGDMDQVDDVCVIGVRI